ncbi:UNVERIFIED_CONTAM: hypothetical protein GTU68_063187 [Idotea baltica]|nr:hypothetical protein [Idotea baltica]
MRFSVAAFYKFVTLPDYEDRRVALAMALQHAGVKGTVLLASEGVNGTIAGTPVAIESALTQLRALPGCADLEAKFSETDEMPFLRLKVRLKREIVTMGVPETDPNLIVGTYVKPADWNALIGDPETILIDTRNDYEVAIGTFEGAIDPNTKTFREFPEWFRKFREKLEGDGKAPKVAMFCTGGIRCEKATSFLKAEGVDEVFHLEGGILKYLEEVPAENSTWNGECFVFDERVSVTHDLSRGSYDMCHGCKHPVSAEDMAAESYVPGISCPHCIDVRQKQIELAKARGEAHMGPDAVTASSRKSEHADG